MARPTKNDSKKDKRSVYVTPEAWTELDRIADEFMLSRSDLIEMVGQRRLKIERVEQTA